MHKHTVTDIQTDNKILNQMILPLILTFKSSHMPLLETVVGLMIILISTVWIIWIPMYDPMNGLATPA